MGKFVRFLEKIKYFVLSALNVISHCFYHEFSYIIHYYYSSSRNHNPVLSSFVTYHEVWNKQVPLVEQELFSQVVVEFVLLDL